MTAEPITMAEAGVSEAAAQELKGRLRGALLRPGEDGYEAARHIWNAMIDKRPALIARCAGAADVIAALQFARGHGLSVAVRGGGHNVAGTALCDGGLVIDLTAMKGIEVGADAGAVRCQPGLTWGEVDWETQAFGRAVPCGIVSTTGISGLTLGGGFGWLSRKYGLTCDNLLSADVVTADGRLLTASETENADLFWGLRGGGGNFGIVTSFHYRAQPVGPTVVGGLVLYGIDRAADVIDFFGEFTAAAPDALGSLLMVRIAPPAPFLPPEVHGKPVAGMAFCYAGPVEEGLDALQQVRAFGKPLADTIGPKPFRAVQSMFDAAQPAGRHYYWKSEYLAGIDAGVRDVFVAQGGRLPSAQSSLLVMQLGGAIRRVSEDATAAAHRDANYIVNIGASWLGPEQTPDCVGWARDFWTAVRPHGTGGVYVNFLTSDEGDERVQAAYGAQKYRRLAALKTKYDPDNVFRSNMNIRPSA